MRRRRVLLVLVAVVVMSFLALSGNTALRYLGVFSNRETPAEVAALIGPAMQARWPAGEGPFPTALLLSGCDGPADNLAFLADGLAGIGWASIIVDSHGPRDYDEPPLWSLICAGQLFTGTERAGDLAVALDLARAMPEVDAERIALIGASHGGWAVLDLMALQAQGPVPPTLTRWPATLEARGLAGVRSVILYYPYCGPGSRVWRWGWRQAIPALFLLVAEDSVTGEEDCLSAVAMAEGRGLPVRVERFEGVTHGFDQEKKFPLSVLEFDPAARARAFDLVRETLAPL